MNDYQTNRFSTKMVETMFKSVSGKRIAVFGLAFKKDTGEWVWGEILFVALYRCRLRGEWSVALYRCR